MFYRHRYAGLENQQSCWCRDVNDTWPPVAPETCMTCLGEYNYERECGKASVNTIASVYDVTGASVERKGIYLRELHAQLSIFLEMLSFYSALPPHHGPVETCLLGNPFQPCDKTMTNRHDSKHYLPASCKCGRSLK